MDNLTEKEQKQIEKARKKAARPFYKKKRFILPVALILFVIAVNAIANIPAPELEGRYKVKEYDREPVKRPVTQKPPTNHPAKKNDPGISLTEFYKIETGMTYDEVKEIVGSGGELISETQGAQYHFAIVQWYGEPGNMIGANANVTFENGKVMSKAQFGLE